MIKRITSIVLVLIMVLSLCPVTAEEDYANRLYTLEQFIYSIGVNNLAPLDGTENYQFADWTQVKAEDRELLEIGLKNGIIMGDGDTIRPYDKVLRVEAFVMLSRALDSLTMTEEPLVFKDTPDWAKADIDRLSAAGLVKGTAPDVLGADDYITKEQVGILADRIDTIYTTTAIEDDYYAAVNSKWLRNNTVPSGYTSWSTMSDMNKRAEDAVKSIISSYAKAPQGSTRKNVYNYYLSAIDTEGRNAMGIEPIKPYLEMLDASRTKTDILEVMANIAKDNYMYSILPVAIAPDELNTDKMLVTLYAADTGMGSYYLIEDEAALKAYKTYLTDLFKLAGEEERGLNDRIDAIINLQKAFASASLNYYEYLEFENRYNEYDLESFSNAFYNIDLQLYFDVIGIPMPKRFIVEEVRQMNIINSFMTDEHIDLLKDYVRAVLLKDSATFLSQDFMEATKKFSNNFYQVEGDSTDEEEAILLTDSAWGMVIGMDYLGGHYSNETTKAIEDMTHELIDTYKKRINKLDWLSDKTKESAVKKLDTTLIKIGGAAEYPEYLDRVVSIAPEDGGNLFNNTAKLSAAAFQENIKTLSTGFDRNEWGISAHTVNAFYSPISNEIVLPAGILQSPLYSPDNTYEENLGGIGTVIAHELSHAFDSSGAQYDEKGNIKDWWTEDDYNAFEERSQAVADRYSKIEVIDGQYVNGEYTLNENIADLGAMSCVLETAQSHDEFDYDRMFRNFAYSWAEVIPDKNLITQLINDEHSPAKVRVNGVLQNFEKFYEIYGVEKDDKMYLTPEDRVHIW